MEKDFILSGNKLCAEYIGGEIAWCFKVKDTNVYVWKGKEAKKWRNEIIGLKAGEAIPLEILEFHNNIVWQFALIDIIEERTKYKFFMNSNSVGFELIGDEVLTVTTEQLLNDKETKNEAIFKLFIQLFQALEVMPEKEFNEYIRKQNEFKKDKQKITLELIKEELDAIEKLEDFKIYATNGAFQVYHKKRSYPHNFIIDADFKHDFFGNLLDGLFHHDEVVVRRLSEYLKEFDEKHPMTDEKFQNQVGEFYLNHLKEKGLDDICEIIDLSGFIIKDVDFFNETQSTGEFIERLMNSNLKGKLNKISEFVEDKLESLAFNYLRSKEKD